MAFKLHHGAFLFDEASLSKLDLDVRCFSSPLANFWFTTRSQSAVFSIEELNFSLRKILLLHSSLWAAEHALNCFIIPRNVSQCLFNLIISKHNFRIKLKHSWFLMAPELADGQTVNLRLIKILDAILPSQWFIWGENFHGKNFRGAIKGSVKCRDMKIP